MNWLFGGDLLLVLTARNFQSITALAPLFYSWLVVFEIQWCLVCGHLVHAMRQVDKNYDVNPIDNMFCECKEVQSVEGCSNYGNTKFGLSSGIPRYYHEQVGKSEFEAKCIQMQGIVA